MCGIAGIIGRINDPNRAALERMATAMAHRGPDSAGFWTSPADQNGDGCLFAHRRLSILDLSTAADQPMTDPVAGQTIIFNGEIYNYNELRRELMADGQQFQSTGDTAVMLRLLALRGPKSVQKLRGMFAFGLWDPAKRELLLAHDPHGIKPLYVCRNPDTSDSRTWSLLFASEVRSILASGLIAPRLNPAAVASMIWNGFVVGPETAVLGIESLWPGGSVLLDARGREVSSEIFWHIPPPGANDGSEEALRESLLESVRLHLASDVPLAVFLSSGVDSSAVANLAKRASQTPVHTFTLAFEDESLNEGHHARAIAKAIGTEHQEVLLTESDFVNNLDRALDSLDQPSFDGLNTYYVSKAVREAGFTVALAGTGGDELFGGYTSFQHLPPLHQWAHRTGWVPQFPKVAAAKLFNAMLNPTRGDVAPQTKWAKLPDMIKAGGDLLALYQLAYALFLPDFQRELLGVNVNGQLRDGLPLRFRAHLEKELRQHSTLSSISAMEQRCFLGERLLRDSDATSMAVSLETRLPLVDQVLTEQVARLPEDQRYEPLRRKQMLRKIGLSGLDPALFERPKQGFVLPYDRWIRKGLGDALVETMSDSRAAAAVGLNGTATMKLWSSFQTARRTLLVARLGGVCFDSVVSPQSSIIVRFDSSPLYAGERLGEGRVCDARID